MSRRGRGLSIEAVTNGSEVLNWSPQFPEQCVICCEQFASTCIIRKLECGHVYHLMCVDKWFIKHTSCPLCKHDLKALASNRSMSSLSRSSSDSSLRYGTVLFGHSNSDPALLRGFAVSISQSPLRDSVGVRRPAGHSLSTGALGRGPLDSGALGLLSSSSMPTHVRSTGMLSMLPSSSSGTLPVVEEVSDEIRSGSPLSASRRSGRARSADATSSEESPRQAAELLPLRARGMLTAELANQRSIRGPDDFGPRLQRSESWGHFQRPLPGPDSPSRSMTSGDLRDVAWIGPLHDRHACAEDALPMVDEGLLLDSARPERGVRLLRCLEGGRDGSQSPGADPRKEDSLEKPQTPVSRIYPQAPAPKVRPAPGRIPQRNVQVGLGAPTRLVWPPQQNFYPQPRVQNVQSQPGQGMPYFLYPR